MAKVVVKESGGEGVAGTYGIGDRDAHAAVLADFVGSDEQAAVCAARDADEPEAKSVTQPVRGTLFVRKIPAEGFDHDR